MNKLKNLILIVSFIGFIHACSEDCYYNAKASHHVKGVSDKEIELIDKLVRSHSNLRGIFRNINLIRPVGSRNHEMVQEFIKNYMRNLQWDVKEDRFTKNTLIGTKVFVNIIGTQNATKSRRLILSCHYDSLNKDGFYTSTDSALPCSLMLSVAEILNSYLQSNANVDVSLELVFFDGEEAFVSWSDTDSLYGSRHLAKLWHNQIDDCQCSKLKRIDSLILLDLLGADQPKFYNFDFGNRFFDSMKTIEKRIARRDLFRDYSGHPYFQSYELNTVIQDDHVPFMKKKVPFLHLIAVPFPNVWHTINDNANNINWDVSEDLELMFTTFIIEFFHLSVYEFNV